MSNKLFHVRFLAKGCNVCLETGETLPKGANIIHQYFYHITKLRANLIVAQFKQLNNFILRVIYSN